MRYLMLVNASGFEGAPGVEVEEDNGGWKFCIW